MANNVTKYYVEMNEYLIYSSEGYTEGPNEEVEVDNCQLLGRVFGDSALEAEIKLCQENRWIKECGFRLHKTTTVQILTEAQRKDVETVVDYLLSKEMADFYDNHFPENHIANVLLRLKKMVAQ